MTLTEKILAKAAGREDVAPNDNIWVQVDNLMTHDVCGPGTFGLFKKEFGPKAKVSQSLPPPAAGPEGMKGGGGGSIGARTPACLPPI